MKAFFTTLLLMTAALYCMRLHTDSISVASFTKTEPVKIKVLVIDTGISPHPSLKKYLPKDTTSNAYIDLYGHGTHIAGIIAMGDQQETLTPACENLEIHSCRFWTSTGDKTNDALQETINCLKEALKNDFDFINYSAGGEEPSYSEERLLRQLSAKGVRIITAAGNEGRLLQYSQYYPAKYDIDGLVAVGNMNHNKSVSSKSNYGGGMIYDYGENIYSTLPGNKMGFMTGTSQAAAMYTHRLIKKKCSQIDNSYKKQLQDEEEKIRLKLYGGKHGKYTDDK